MGPGPLKNREDQKLHGTDKERTLFTPQDPFYRQVAEECADAGIGINLFVLPIQYIDIASIGMPKINCDLGGNLIHSIQIVQAFSPV